MIEYKYSEEKTFALFIADELGDTLSRKIIEKDQVSSKEEAIHLSKFYWAMIDKSAEGISIPCEGSAQYWTEKLYNSIGGYLERAGYEDQWNDEIDKA